MGTPRSSKGKIRVVVADEEGIFRLGVKKLLAVEDDLRVVGEAENARELLSRVEAFQPDIVFVHEEILAGSEDNLIAALLKIAPKCKVVATISASSEDSSLRHVRSGASGVIMKTVDPQLFVKCARRVCAGDTWVPKKHVSTMAKMLETGVSSTPRPVDTLTRREKTIISYLMQGWRNREIGNHLTISEQTVKNHLRTIYDKVGVSDRLELVLYAIHQKMELPPVRAMAPPT
jgi:two-component system, NarL family, nitrate/nitrite response regulator NarL